MKNNLNEFRNDNTNGQYSDDELNVMNMELAEKLDDLGYDNIDDVPDSILKYNAEQIVDKH
jgi:hypothetical protein